MTTTVSKPGATDGLTFAGSAGQKIAVLESGSTLPHGCDIALEGADQSVVSLLCDFGGDGVLGTAMLPRDGTYTLLVDPADEQ